MDILFMEQIFSNKILYFGLLTFFIILSITFVAIIIWDQNLTMQNKNAKNVKKKSKKIEPIEELSEEKKIEQQKAKLELEKMVQSMQEDIDGKDKSEQAVVTYEQEQEEKAIISYQELVNAVRNKGAKKETIVVESVVEQQVEQPIEQAQQLTERVEPKKEEQITTNQAKKFTNSDFISPVFGKLQGTFEELTATKEHSLPEPKVSKPVLVEPELDFQFKPMHYHNLEIDKEPTFKHEDQTLEETLRMKPIPEEIKKNDEFLKALKEFRSNLE